MGVGSTCHSHSASLFCLQRRKFISSYENLRPWFVWFLRCLILLDARPRTPLQSKDKFHDRSNLSIATCHSSTWLGPVSTRVRSVLSIPFADRNRRRSS